MKKAEYILKVKTLRSIDQIKEITLEYAKNSDADQRCLDFLNFEEFNKNKYQIRFIIDQVEHGVKNTKIQFGWNLLQKIEKDLTPEEIIEWIWSIENDDGLEDTFLYLEMIDVDMYPMPTLQELRLLAILHLYEIAEAYSLIKEINLNEFDENIHSVYFYEGCRHLKAKRRQKEYAKIISNFEKAIQENDLRAYNMLRLTYIEMAQT